MKKIIKTSSRSAISYGNTYYFFPSILLGLIFLVFSPVPVRSAIVLTHAVAAPSTDSYDISNIVAATGTLPQTTYSNDSGNKGTGQSFTIGASPLTLDTFSIKGGGNGVTNTAQWNLVIYQVGAANSLTALTSALTLTDQTPPYFHPEASDWLTFSFTGANAITLAANTQYAFQVSTSVGDSSFFAFAQADNSVIAAPLGGDGLSFNGLAPDATTATDLNYNYIYNVGLSVVPEPSIYALILVGLVFLGSSGYRRRQARA